MSDVKGRKEVEMTLIARGHIVHAATPRPHTIATIPCMSYRIEKQEFAAAGFAAGTGGVV